MNESRLEFATKNNSEKVRKSIDEQCCEEPNVESVDGEVVCKNCGVVHRRDIVNLRKRAYTAQEVENRIQTEPRWREYGPRTTIPSARREDNMNAQQKSLFVRLSKIQKSLISSIERNFWEARPKLKKMTTMLNIPRYIEDTAWRIYTEAAKRKMTLGRTIKGFVGAALYASIRVHNYPRILDEVCGSIEIPRHKVIKSLGLIIKEIMPELGLKYQPVTAEQLVYRFGSELDMNLTTQKQAYNLLTQTKDNGLIRTGKDPRGFTAAALYMAASSTVDKRTQVEVSNIAGITEVTLRNRIKDIKKAL